MNQINNMQSVNFGDTNQKAPKFYKQAFRSRRISFFLSTLLTTAVSVLFILLLLSIFVEGLDAKIFNVGINYDYWPVLIVAAPLYLIIMWSWLSNLILYVGFSKEYRKYKRNFPLAPTNYVKKTFVFLHGRKNSLAWFAAAVYITLILSVGIIYLIVFSINSWNLGGKETVAETAQLILVHLDQNGKVYSYALRFYIIIIGAIAAGFLVFHIFMNLLLKLQINRIEIYYNGGDNVVDPNYLANKVKRVNRRNMILFACYMIILIVMFILIIKLPKKIFPNSKLGSKILTPWK